MKSVKAETENEVQHLLGERHEFSTNRYLLLTDAEYDSVEFSRCGPADTRRGN